MSALVAPSLFTREQLAREITDPRLLTRRRAVSLAFRHYRLAEDTYERTEACERLHRHHFDAESDDNCWVAIPRAHERLEGAIAAFRENEAVPFDIDELLADVRRKQDSARRAVWSREYWGNLSGLRDSLQRWPTAENRGRIRECIARKRASMTGGA